jgi:YD repeat-containing protein
MTVPGQSAVNYCWDNANRLNGVSQQPCPNNHTVGFQYDNANRRTTLTLPNGVSVGYTYDNDWRVTAMTSAPAARSWAISSTATTPAGGALRWAAAWRR